MKVKKHETSLKTKFFLSMSSMMISVIVLLLLIMSIIFYHYFFSMQAESSVKQLTTINNQLHFYLTSMDNYSKMMISDTNIQKNVKMFEAADKLYTETDRVNLRSEMRKFLQTIPYIHSATIYSDDYTCIASTAVAAYSSPVEALVSQEKTVYVITPKYSNINIKSEIQTLSLIRPFYEISTGKKLGYIEISIPEQDIHSLYEANTSDTSKLFITDRKGTVVSTDGTYSLNQTFLPVLEFKGTIPEKFRVEDRSICFVSYIETLDWFIVNEIKLSAFYKPLYLILLITIVISILFFGGSMIVSRKISNTITRPLYLLIQHIQKVKKGNWSLLNNVPEDVDFHLLFQEFDSMLLSQEKLTHDLISVQKTKDKLSLDLLQQQVNPHFLYNTLDNIGSLAALDETDKLITLVTNLSDFYRHSLSGGNSIISIKEELALTQVYANIMQIRYVNKFSFSIECPKNIEKYSCLKLLLQPVIENSIYHGVKELDQYGYINVKVQKIEAGIQFVVEDNGIGMKEKSIEKDKSTDNRHFGVRSIQKRIEMYYGKNFGLTMQNIQPSGLRTTILIPVQKWSRDDL